MMRVNKLSKVESAMEIAIPLKTGSSCASRYDSRSYDSMSHYDS